MSDEDIIGVVGSVEPKALPQVVSVRLDPAVAADLRDIANERGVTVSDLLRRGAQLAMNERSVDDPFVVAQLLAQTVDLIAACVVADGERHLRDELAKAEQERDVARYNIRIGRLTCDISKDLRERAAEPLGPLAFEAADQLDELITSLAKAENERDAHKTAADELEEQLGRVRAQRDALETSLGEVRMHAAADRERANDAARLSAAARDEAEDLGNKIAELHEHISIVEADRLELQEQRGFVLSLCDDAEQIVGRAGFLRVDAIRKALDTPAGAAMPALGDAWSSAGLTLAERNVVEAARTWAQWYDHGRYGMPNSPKRFSYFRAIEALDAAVGALPAAETSTPVAASGPHPNEPGPSVEPSGESVDAIRDGEKRKFIAMLRDRSGLHADGILDQIADELEEELANCARLTAMPAKTIARACGAIHRPDERMKGFYVCSLDPGHTGDHAALRNTVVWPRKATDLAADSRAQAGEEVAGG